MIKKFLIVAIISPLVLVSCDKLDITRVQTESFFKYFSLNPANQGAGVCAIPGGGYALLGTTETEFTGTKICLIITDEFGNSLQPARYYGGRLDDRGHCIKPASGGGFLILGSTQDTVRNESDLDILLIRTDEKGDTLWTRTFNGNNGNDEGYYLETGNNQEIFLAGYTTISHQANGSVVTSRQIWLHALDENGNNLWPFPKAYGGRYEDEGKCLQIMDDGLVLTGKTKNYMGATANSPFHSFIMKTNLTGGLKSPLVSFGDNADEEGNCLKVLDDTTFLISGTTNSATTGGSDIFLYQVKWRPLSGADPFQIDHVQKFGSSFNDMGRCMMLQGSSVMLLGTIGTTENSSAIALINTTPDGKGNPKTIHYGDYSQFEGKSFSLSEDGGYIIAGTNYRSDNSSITLIKTKTGGGL
jgi:hypothetical protein